MARFSYADMASIQEFLLVLHETMDSAMLSTLVPSGIGRLIPCDRVSFNEIDFATAGRSVIPAPVPSYWLRLGSVFRDHMHEHELMNPDCPPPLHRATAFSDWRDGRAWRDSVLLNEYYREIEVRHQLGVSIVHHGTTRVNIGINRASRDFSLRDRAVLEWLSPHIACAWRNARLVAALRQPGNDTQPLQGVRLTLSSRGRLTTRETDVLQWIVEGKRNAEIAIILGVSPRTVEKHAENLYAKIGVENRGALIAHVFHHRRT